MHELAAQSLLPFHPAWALDSREIAFEAEAFGKSEIWLIRAARLTDGSLVKPDGELIRETLPVTGHRFWTMGQGGTIMATLPKPPAKFTRGLSISPDGRYALYCEDDVDRYEIRVVENFR